MKGKHTIYLSIGTNIGDREKNIDQALSRLKELMALEHISAVYETAPWGPVQDQNSFFNLCVAGETHLDPADFLDAAKAIEREIGRLDGIRWGPRLIDIDLLFYEDVQLLTDRLILPHKEVAGRAFVLVPLAEIAPDLEHPILNQTVLALKDQLPSEEIDSVSKLSSLDLTRYVTS